jgi:hypothetical protein
MAMREFSNNLKTQIKSIFGQSAEYNVSFDNPFPFGKQIAESVFVDYCLENIYRKILTDCYAKTRGIEAGHKKFYWDTVVKSYGKSNADKGLITMLAKAMAAKEDLFLVYKSDVLRRAGSKESESIREAFDNKSQTDGQSPMQSPKGQSPRQCPGYWFSFMEYTLSDILKVLYGFQYIILGSTYTSMNTAKALQLKINDLRRLVSDNDRANPIKQGTDIVAALKEGKSVMLDVADKIEHSSVDMEPTEVAVKFINGMIAFYLNAPLSYVNGQLAQGLSTTGESDGIAVERCLESFFNSVLKPVSDEIFKSDISFVCDNWRRLGAVANIMPVIESTGLICDEKKRKLVEELF